MSLLGKVQFRHGAKLMMNVEKQAPKSRCPDQASDIKYLISVSAFYIQFPVSVTGHTIYFDFKLTSVILTEQLSKQISIL